MSHTAEVSSGLQVAAFLGAALYSGLLGSVWDSWSVNYDRIMIEKARVAEVQKAAEEDSYRVVCPDYFSANWTDRNLGLWNLRWCKAYEDRL